MAATYEPIASVTLGSDAASIDFSSIPGTYTDLVLSLHLRTAGNYAVRSVALQFNGDTGSNYSATALSGNGSSAASIRASSQDEVYIGEMGGNVGYPTPTLVSIQSYANTNVFKTLLSASAAPATIVYRVVGLWSSTSAITSIKIKQEDSGNNLASGSSAALFGIKAA